MGLLHRLKMGYVLTKDSISVLYQNPSLALFPFISGLTGLAFLGIFLGTTFGVIGLNPDGVSAAVLFVLYLVLTFITTFFSAALVDQTAAALAGKDPSLSAGINAASEVTGQLFVWSFCSATVSVAINLIEESDSLPARIVAMVFSVAWSLMTFFIVPTIVFEETPITGMFKQSAGTFKETWGEMYISMLGVQLFAFLVFIPFIGGAYAVFTLGSIIGAVAITFTGILTAVLVLQTLQGVIKTSLYLYAKEGVHPEQFDNVDFERMSPSGGR